MKFAMSKMAGMKQPHLKITCSLFALSVALATAAVPVRAHGDASAVSALSALPVVVSVAAPAGLLSAGAAFTVVAVEASVDGTMWVLERASDGARASVKLGAQAVGGVSLATGAVVTCVAVGTGLVLSAAGRAIAFVPNQIGAALLHNEKITK